MFFFCTWGNQNKSRCSLQVRIRSFAPTNEKKEMIYKKINMKKKSLKVKLWYKKRTSQFTLLSLINISNKQSKGSMTIETALVLPIFIYAIMSIIYFLQIISMQEIISEGIIETGKYASRYAYVYQYLFSDDETEEVTDDEAKDKTKENEVNYFRRILDGVLLKQKLKEFVNTDLINKSCIVGGYNGIHLYQSSFLENDELIEIVASYKVRFPILFFNIRDMNMMQRVKLKAWTGYGGKAKKGDITEEDIVYITQTGSVYHITKECTHLKLSIRETYYNIIENLRNQAGGKYTLCEICDDTKLLTENSIIYITNTGDRYHTIIGCSGLKRIIIEIPMSQIEDKNGCKRCVN